MGPYLTVWTLVSLGSLLGNALTILGRRFDQWAIAMLVGTFFASAVAVALVAADVLLLRMKVRALPEGGRAWLSSLAAPLTVMMTLARWPFPVDSALGAVIAISAALVLGAFGARFLIGTPIARA